MSTGIVYLVGAGPGDPGLITVRGLACLRQADVVVHDRLVSEALLEEAPPWAERIFAGKAPGRPGLGQEEINRLLIQQAQAGRVVVRLKGGDPFVFGRGGEEATACTAAGVPWEIVPGVSSVTGVPGRAGIPITYRHISSAFAVITAHRAEEQDDDLNWAALARIDTVIVLMGAQRLAQVVARLMEHGRSPDTPIAIIERGTQPDERVLTGTLADITQKAAQSELGSPTMLVIGEIVNLRERLNQQEPYDSKEERSRYDFMSDDAEPEYVLTTSHKREGNNYG